MDENIYYAVYPRGDKLDITDKITAVAFCKYESHAKELRKRWPTTGEVIPISKEKLIELLKKE